MKHFSKIVKEECCSNNHILFETLLNSSTLEFEAIMNTISNSKRFQKQMLNSILTVFSTMKNQISSSKCDNVDTVKLNFSAALSLLESQNIKSLVPSERITIWKSYEEQILSSETIFLQDENNLEQLEYMEDTVLYYEKLVKKRARQDAPTSNKNVKSRT